MCKKIESMNSLNENKKKKLIACTFLYNLVRYIYSVWSDVLSEPVINNPGAYRSVCVELDVST